MQGTDAACERTRMDEGVAGPIRELDKTIPFLRIVPLYFARNRRDGWFRELWWFRGLWFRELRLDELRLDELWLGRLQRGLGSALRVAGVLVLDNLPSSS
jgi:hypothetical protein